MTPLYLRIPCFPNYVSPSVVKVFPSTKLNLGCTKTNLTQTFTKASSLHCLPSSMSSLTELAPLEAVLFDVDGTLCDSDPLHYEALREMLLKIGFNGGVSITEEFFVEKFSGKNNVDTASVPFPDDPEQGLKFVEDKEAMFQRLAREQLKPVKGLDKVIAWVEKRGLKRAAVTNSPRVNAELMISKLGLSDFFDVLIIGDECERGKPHPDPYLKALEVLKTSKDHAFVFEDSFSGITAGVAAGMPVIGIASRNPEDLLMKAKPAFLIKDYEDPKLWEALEELDKPGAEKLELLDKKINKEFDGPNSDESSCQKN